jgi:hypothetical protein
MPRPKRTEPAGKTAYHLYDITGLVRDRRHALDLFQAGKLKLNGKPVHPDDTLDPKKGVHFSVEVDGQLRGLSVPKGWFE